MNNVTMCIHEQCVPNLAVPPWRPGYEANECVYMCTFRLYSAQGNLILCLNLSQTSLHYAQKIISFFVIMHYGQKNGGLHRLVYIIIVIMHCHNITKHTCMYVLVLTWFLSILVNDITNAKLKLVHTELF